MVRLANGVILFTHQHEQCLLETKLMFFCVDFRDVEAASKYSVATVYATSRFGFEPYLKPTAYLDFFNLFHKNFINRLYELLTTAHNLN